ncbi:MAG TPA: cytochrome c biogenesis protein CcsA [Myxococcota bacterium]|nr:cytochrome c biogenesis protein CcsA [Myxococcota bacterium]HOH75636.1 cytochrome c biogenesis protein CcsA [Myxococcota bacterium]
MATAALLAGDIFRNRLVRFFGIAALFGGTVATVVAIILRWLATGHPPLSNLHESFVFIGFATGLAALVVELTFRTRLVGAASALVAVLALGYASVLDSSIRPLMPALKSNWLIIHVTSYFLGYGALAVATVASALQLAWSFVPGADPSSLKRIDLLAFRLVLLAFPLLTLGLTTGAVWASFAWGRYWGWDPKETWSLVTWLVYALYLHLRAMRGWRGRRMAVVALVGFVFVLFTFLGVNFFVGGLHSYR